MKNLVPFFSQINQILSNITFAKISLIDPIFKFARVLLN